MSFGPGLKMIGDAEQQPCRRLLGAYAISAAQSLGLRQSASILLVVN